MNNLVPTLSTTLTRLFTFIFLFSIVGLSSCKKKEENIPDTSFIRFINVSPTIGTYNIYLNDNMINTAAIPFGGTLSYTSYISGNKTIKYTTASSIQPVLTKQITLAKDKIYSLYLIDKNDKMDALLLTDEPGVASTTKAMVKFINLSPDAPALSLDINGGANLFKDKTYKNGSEYIMVDPKTYALDIKDSATGVVKTSLTDLQMLAGRYYTIVARGMLNPATNDQSFSAQSILTQ